MIKSVYRCAPHGLIDLNIFGRTQCFREGFTQSFINETPDLWSYATGHYLSSSTHCPDLWSYVTRHYLSSSTHCTDLWSYVTRHYLSSSTHCPDLWSYATRHYLCSSILLLTCGLMLHVITSVLQPTVLTCGLGYTYIIHVTQSLLQPTVLTLFTVMSAND